MNPLFTRRNGRIYYDRYTFHLYDFHCWLQSYNRYNQTDIRPTVAPAEIVDEFVKYTKLSKKVGYINAQRQSWPRWFE